MNEFDGKAALVAGTTGIGRAIALRLAGGGARVLACGIDTNANAELHADASAQGLQIEVEFCDVSLPASVEHVVGLVSERLGGIDILVNAAAIHPLRGVSAADAENECGRQMREPSRPGRYPHASRASPRRR